MNQLHLITLPESPDSLYAQTNVHGLYANDVMLACSPMKEVELNTLGRFSGEPLAMIVDCHLFLDTAPHWLINLPGWVPKGSSIYLRNFTGLFSLPGIQSIIGRIKGDHMGMYKLYNPLAQTLPDKCSSYAATNGYLSPLIAHVCVASQTYSTFDHEDNPVVLNRCGHHHARMTFPTGCKIDIRILQDKDRDQGYCMGDGAIRRITPELNALELSDIARGERDSPEYNSPALSDAMWMYLTLTK